MPQMANQHQTDLNREMKPKYLTNEDYAVQDWESAIIVTMSDTENHTITLPPVAESAGRILSIYLVSMSGSNDVIVADAGDDGKWSNVTLDTEEDEIIVISNGLKWTKIAEDIT